MKPNFSSSSKDDSSDVSVNSRSPVLGVASSEDISELSRANVLTASGSTPRC